MFKFKRPRPSTGWSPVKRGRTGKQYYNPSTGRYSSVPYHSIPIQQFDFGAMNRNYYTQRPVAGLAYYNTDTNEVLRKKGHLVTAVDSTFVTQEVHFPIQTTQMGTAIIAEIIKCTVEFNRWPGVAAVTEETDLMAFTLSKGLVVTDDIGDNNNIFSIHCGRTGAFTAGGSYGMNMWLNYTQDVSDGNGNGIYVTEPCIAGFITIGIGTGLSCNYCIYYKLKEVSTAKFISNNAQKNI